MTLLRAIALCFFSSSVAFGQERAVDAVFRCDSARPSAAQVFTRGASLTSLAGKYRLLAIDTANVRFPSGRGTSLELALPDSATVRREKERDASSPLKLGPSELVGVVYFDEQRRYWQRVKVRRATLIVGCPDYDCADGVRSFYYILWYTPDAFGGLWKRPEIGMAVPIDPITGKRLPDGAGYYCAVRDTGS